MEPGKVTFAHKDFTVLQGPRVHLETQENIKKYSNIVWAKGDSTGIIIFV